MAANANHRVDSGPVTERAATAATSTLTFATVDASSDAIICLTTDGAIGTCNATAACQPFVRSRSSVAVFATAAVDPLA